MPRRCKRLLLKTQSVCVCSGAVSTGPGDPTKKLSNCCLFFLFCRGLFPSAYGLPTEAYVRRAKNLGLGSKEVWELGHMNSVHARVNDRLEALQVPHITTEPSKPRPYTHWPKTQGNKSWTFRIDYLIRTPKVKKVELTANKYKL